MIFNIENRLKTEREGKEREKKRKRQKNSLTQLYIIATNKLRII